MPDRSFNFQITLRTLTTIFVFIAGLYLIYQLQAIIVMLFVSWLFTASVNPLISYLETRHVPRGISLAGIYLVGLTLLTVTIASLVPPLISEMADLLDQIELPPALTTSLSEYNLQELEVIARQLTSLPRFAGVLMSTFSSFVTLITFGIITYYLIIERPHLHTHLTAFFGKNHDEKEVERFVNNFENKVGGWVRAELSLMFIIGLMTYVGLALLGIEYALPLAILAGLLELIPNIGPTISAIPAILIATFAYSLPMGLVVTGLYIIIQQIENNLIVPKVMKHAVGIHPLVTILLIIVGLELKGVLGAILAIPLFLAIKVGVKEWSKLKRPGEAITQTLKQFKA